MASKLEMAKLVEFREDADGIWYTKAQFEEYYGGTKAWDAAIDSRMMKERVVPPDNTHENNNRGKNRKKRRRKNRDTSRRFVGRCIC